MRLLLTLGHNASAILEDNNAIIVGYEEERLSGVKSDSSFPVLSINKILEYYPEARIQVTEVCISHWFWDFSLPESKYYKPKYIAVNFPKATIRKPNYYLTHHDLHAKSVWNFLDGDNSGLTIVADGFGNNGECLSIYIDGKLDYRSYGIHHSLGLMYQYAIGYLGMKENQDEYKLLGYEQQVDKYFKVNYRDKLEELIDVTYYGLMTKGSMQVEDMSVILPAVRERWYKIFNEYSPDMNRASIAYVVQTVLEGVMMKLAREYGIKNIKVSGGVFYNVKLNNALLRFSDKFEANPLAGDQGCALGFTNVRYDNLFWGRREYEPIDVYLAISKIENIGYTEIFTGWMEFGPRALCNTTTLSLPRLNLVEEINTINGRDTVMPMAPVVTEKYASENFIGVEKVNKSKYFMVIAFDYISMYDNIRGAAHYDSDRDVYTGRIQVSTSEKINEILEQFGGILINTSLNAHGQPIIYNNQDFATMRRIQESHK